MKEFGGSLDFNVATFMENGTGAFHNHEHSMLIWAITPLTACLFPDIYAASALSAALSLQISNATSGVISFPLKVFYSLSYHTALLTVSDEITAKIVSDTVRTGKRESIQSLATSLQFSVPQRRRTFWQSTSSEENALPQVSWGPVLWQVKPCKLYLAIQEVAIHISRWKYSVYEYQYLLVLDPWKGC